MKKNNKKRKVFKIFFILAGIMIAIATLSLSAFFGLLYLGGDDPDMNMLNNSKQSVKIYDNDDRSMIDDEDQDYIDGSQIPKLLSDAFVAVEDKRFYSHHGVDYVRIAGAAINNLRGNRTQGASTITQQLVKNTYLSSEQTFSRKFKEMQTAIKLEKRLSKDQIMEYYLNMLYFGSGEYGVKNASLRFFGKEPVELNALECAMLAGIVKSPTKYNPINNYDNSIARARIVLSLMRDQNKIDDNIYNNYKNGDIIIQNTLIDNTSDKIYLNSAIYEAAQILNINEKMLRNSAYRIYTYYDADTQNRLLSTVLDKEYYGDSATGGIGLVCDNQSRGIKAFATNRNINIFEFKRQVGSTIKPLACYAPALDQGIINPYEKILDEPMSFGDYSPSNYKDQYYGWTSVSDCVSKSLNIPSIKIMQQLGCKTSADYLGKMNIPITEGDQNLALALGGMTYGMSMTDLLGGYATLANYGSYKRPTFIKKILDRDGNLVYDSEKTVEIRVFDEQSSYLMTDMLRNCSKSGTAKKLNTLNFDIACKTGTVSLSNKSFNSDIYSIGYTANDTMLFWQGDSPMDASHTGGGPTTLMLKNFASRQYASKSPEDFYIPNGIEEINIDKFSYENLNKIVIASKSAPKSTVISGIFSQKCIPTDKDTTYDRIAIDDIKFDQSGGNLTISFEYNPKLRYKVYKRDFAKGEYLLEDIKNTSGQANIQIGIDGFFGNKITVIPYYIDDDNREIIGNPQKYYTNSLISGLYE